jgi:hypothetical protein
MQRMKKSNQSWTLKMRQAEDEIVLHIPFSLVATPYCFDLGLVLSKGLEGLTCCPAGIVCLNDCGSSSSSR